MEIWKLIEKTAKINYVVSFADKEKGTFKLKFRLNESRQLKQNYFKYLVFCYMSGIG